MRLSWAHPFYNGPSINSYARGHIIYLLLELKLSSIELQTIYNCHLTLYMSYPGIKTNIPQGPYSICSFLLKSKLIFMLSYLYSNTIGHRVHYWSHLCFIGQAASPYSTNYSTGCICLTYNQICHLCHNNLRISQIMLHLTEVQ